MRGKLFKRVMNVVSAFTLIMGQFVLPANTILTQTAKAGGNDQPVWCKATGSGWQVQLSATSDGKDGPLTIPIAGYDMVNGQVVAHDRSDKILADACAQQYTLTTPTQGVVCGPNNDTVVAGAHMTMSPDPVVWSGGQASVTFTAAGSYQFMVSPGVYSSTTTVNYTDANTACPIIPLPAAPVPNDPCGPDNATWAIPADTATIHWYVSADGHLHAQVVGAYMFPDGTTDHDYGLAQDSGVLCEATKPVVTQVVACGPTNDSFAVTGGANYTTSSRWEGTTLVVTITANSGFEFSDHTTSFEVRFTDANTPCELPVPPAPAPTNPCGVNNASWAVPSDTATIHWYVSADGHLHAKVIGNYIFPDQSTDHDYGLAVDSNTPCVMDNPVTPAPQVQCGPENDIVTAATGAHYSSVVSAWADGTVMITYTADAGYVFQDGTNTFVSHYTDQNTPCPLDLPAAPAPTNPCGVNNASWAVPSDTATIHWYVSVDGHLHAKVIGNYIFPNAETDHDYGLPVDSGVLCTAATPVVTVEAVCGAANNDVVTVNGGSHYKYTIDRALDGTITVTVSVDSADYQFADGKTSYTLQFKDMLEPCTTNLPQELPSIDPCDDLGKVNPPKWAITPEDTNMYAYTLNADGSYTVTAMPGYILNIENVGSVFAYTYRLPLNDPAKTCYQTVKAPVTPAVNYTCGVTSNATWVKPADTTAYTWAIVDGELVVTANEGYVLDDNGDLVTEINFGTATENVTQKPCPAFYSTGYTYHDACGVANDTLTLPENSEHVSYSYAAVNGYFVVTVKAAAGYYLTEADGQYITEGTYRVKMGDFDPTLVCKAVGMGSAMPSVTVAAAPAKTAVAQELPHTGANDNSYMTLFGLVASLATYGAVLSLQRRNA